MDKINIIRTNVRLLLKEKNWTQAYLAELMGVQVNYISSILTGKKGNEMKIPFAEKMAEHLGVTLFDLLTPNFLETDINNKNYENILLWIKAIYLSPDEREKARFELDFEEYFPKYLEWRNRHDKKREDYRESA